MNKFLLASFGLAVIASGLAFGADSTPQSTTASVNLVDLESALLEAARRAGETTDSGVIGCDYEKLITTNLANKQVELAQLEQAQAEAQAVVAKSFWTKGRIAGAVVTGLVVTGALVAAANQKGYTPTALQPYFDRVSNSSLASSVKSVGAWVDTKTAGIRAVIGSKASSVGSVIGSGASYVGSTAKGAYNTVSSKASGLMRGWFQKAPVVAPVVAPAVAAPVRITTPYSSFNNPSSAAFAS